MHKKLTLTNTYLLWEVPSDLVFAFHQWPDPFFNGLRRWVTCRGPIFHNNKRGQVIVRALCIYEFKPSTGHLSIKERSQILTYCKNKVHPISTFKVWNLQNWDRFQTKKLSQLFRDKICIFGWQRFTNSKLWQLSD